MAKRNIRQLSRLDRQKLDKSKLNEKQVNNEKSK